ncbi:type IV secretion protein Rhs [Stenotrophomonas maltophilia]|uniref:RHS repeat-associated core domain-containing protein n=1 Tax=Stenotrophomonas geniculata TaxID=86188 RepID=UPI00069FF9BD|nr:RHS repeat-associated core domain-containing protein [Stenotrophomonas geniculata]MCB7147064.1 type IV secretion protein Rhs [Stenotrophomonas maltophilia]MCF3501250.1 type IV secretion protein Rhs [Stenotrophomonas maltophilia]
MYAEKLRMAAAVLLGFVLILICQVAHAQAWIELTGPAQTSYTAPATYQLQLKSGVRGTGPKAEYLSGIQLLRNGQVISRLPNGTYTENGISPGSYQYVYRALAVRNVNGDEFTRELTSPVITITVAAPPAPFDGAEYVSASWPRSADRGTPFSGTVTFRNTGNTTWRAGDGYRLGQAERYVSSAVRLGITDVAVPHDVGPGGTVTFAFNGAAANENGPSTLQWQMNRNGVRFGSTSSEQTFETTGRLNRGVMYEQEVPTSMETGRTYRVKLKFVNTGNTTWSASAGYALGSWNPNDNVRWGRARVPMPNDVSPQLPAFFEFDVVAPSLPGVYSFQWRLLEEGKEWFGRESDNVQVTVNGPPSKVIGNIDGVTSDGQIRGWACSTGIDSSIDIHVYTGGAAGSGGTIFLTGKADLASEPAVATSCKAGGNHRFSLPMSNEQRRQRAGQPIYVHGISPVGQPNNTIGGSGAFVVPAAPSGTLSVSPAMCQIAAGAQTCNVTLTWSATDSRAELKRDGGSVVGSGASGSIVVPIGAGTNRFTLSVAGDAIAQAAATAKAAPTLPVNPDNPAPTMVRRYVYDDNLRLCKVIEPETGATVFGYDAAGNLAWSASGLELPSLTECNREAPQIAARRVSRNYDASNRLQTVVYPDGLGDQQLEYTPTGQLKTERVFNQDRVPVVTTRTYNSLGSVVSQSRVIGSASARTLAFGYDHMGQHVRTDYPDGYSVQQSLNALGQPVRLQDGTGAVLASNIAYFPSGETAALTYGNGIVRGVTENARQLTSRIVDSGMVDLNYSYDATGNISQISDAVRGDSWKISLGYDRLDRLIQARAPAFGGNGQYTFGYDTLDNIVSMRLPGKRERTFHYDTRNRLELLRDPSGNGVSGFSYDAAGNLAVRNGQTFTYDMGGQLRSAGDVQKYFYDGAGLRAYATASTSAPTSENSPILGKAPITGSHNWDVSIPERGGGELGFLASDLDRSWQYLVGGELIESTQGGETSDYIYLGKRLLAIRTSSATGATLTYLHHDALNTLVATSRANGEVLTRHFWSPYGEADAAPAAKIPGYSGHLADPDTGLVYMGRRYYDPQLARFISPDPLAASTSGGPNFNRYRYASNNPFRFSDPTGACDQATGSHMCNGSWFAGANLTGAPSPTPGGVPQHDPNAPAPAETVKATGLGAIAEYFDERNFFTGQGSLTDFDAVSEAIVVPLMNSPTGSTAAGGLKLASAMVVLREANAAKGFGNLSRAAEFGVMPYNALRRAVAGTGLKSHHLIEKRFAAVVGQRKSQMLSTAVTDAEHQPFTNAWRSAFPYGTNYRQLSADQVMNKAREIYANYPAILKELGL